MSEMPNIDRSTLIHKAMTFEEVRAERYIDGSDYRNCPPKVCGNGNFHARWSITWPSVTCPLCLAKKPQREHEGEPRSRHALPGVTKRD